MPTKASYADLFARQAELYAQFRPRYPAALFQTLAKYAPGRRLVWDCATGNGQAAIGLTEYFARVVATDLSAEQLAQRQRHKNIDYMLASAEHPGLARDCADLVTVAQAAHWLDLPAFYQTVRSVLRPGGILALWCYEMLTISPKIDEVVNYLYKDITGPYWSARRRLIEEHYQTIPFPFAEIQMGEMHMQAEWTFDHLVGYLNSWSAAQKYTVERGQSPVAIVWDDLKKGWGEQSAREVRWQIYMRVGRV